MHFLVCVNFCHNIGGMVWYGTIPYHLRLWYVADANNIHWRFRSIATINLLIIKCAFLSTHIVLKGRFVVRPTEPRRNPIMRLFARHAGFHGLVLARRSRSADNYRYTSGGPWCPDNDGYITAGWRRPDNDGHILRWRRRRRRYRNGQGGRGPSGGRTGAGCPLTRQAL